MIILRNKLSFLTIPRFPRCLKKIHTNGVIFNSKKLLLKKGVLNNPKVSELIIKYEEKLLYNTFIDNSILKLEYKKSSELLDKTNRYNKKIRAVAQVIQPLPISLKYYLNDENYNLKLEENQSTDHCNKVDEDEHTQFPYSSSTTELEYDETFREDVVSEEIPEDANQTELEIRKRYELMKDKKNWMSNYDNYEYDLVECPMEEYDPEINYGTPDPKSKVSSVPCGGCGALLHCKDTAIPGYIPSEIFKNYKKRGASDLSAIICQRCYFLKEFNLALRVQISPEDYTNVLKTIKEKKALVVMLVDLIDFPCSIWPGISDILGNMPIIIAGNKADLLPKDDERYLSRIKNTLVNNMKLHGYATSNIKDVVLISAKTGYGVEELITKLHSIWKYKGDVYLVGCTNVGKSSLFNMLLQSDYCKSKAADLIQRATISPWPGTTLNLLKFPILRPSDHKLFLRYQRLKEYNQIRAEEKKLTGNRTYPELIGHIGKTFHAPPTIQEPKDSFLGRVTMGVDEKHKDYSMSKWCYDTPGVIQPDQILHLLTTDELICTLPKEVIRPKTFCVKPGTTLFLAGLGRLDYLEGNNSIRLTVFRSKELPITVCRLEEADSIYNELLGTDLFKVPINSKDRLLQWPGLELAKSFTLTGESFKASSHDIVLSSAGWIAVQCYPNNQYKFQAWTPEKRGVYLRECLLPNAVNKRGARLRNSIVYKDR